MKLIGPESDLQFFLGFVHGAIDLYRDASGSLSTNPWPFFNIQLQDIFAIFYPGFSNKQIGLNHSKASIYMIQFVYCAEVTQTIIRCNWRTYEYE